MFPLVHHSDYLVGEGSGAHFRWDKYGATVALLRADASPPDEHAPECMPEPWISAIHDPDYVAAVLAAALPRDKERRIGFPVTPALARRAARTCGGTWRAAMLALDYGYAANSAGGSHHALHADGAGYCILNDLAVATHRLLAEGKARHVLIVDLDVHQGDGTASLLAGRSDATTFSMHAARNFPARKARSSLDVDLPDGIADDAYLDLLAHNLPHIVDECRPDFIFYQAGVDAHADDSLGRLSLTDDGLLLRDAMVADAARTRGIPLASVMGGGYGPDAAAIAARHAQTMRTLAHGYYG